MLLVDRHTRCQRYVEKRLHCLQVGHADGRRNAVIDDVKKTDLVAYLAELAAQSRALNCVTVKPRRQIDDGGGCGHPYRVWLTECDIYDYRAYMRG